MKKLNYFVGLMLAVMLGVGQGKVMAQDLTPEILIPDPKDGALLYGLSDNGEWGVSCKSPGYDGFSDFAGASIYDLRSNPVKATDLAQGETYCAGFDVTDDGLTVAGAVRQQPAICRYENGKWNWYELPVPDRKFTLNNVYTDETMTYRLDSGEATNITPDGRYAVGYASCTEYINIEVACMWDLETMELIDMPGLGIENSSFSRFTQISADGRYVVGRRGGYFIYDRQTRTSKSARVGLDIYAQGMSNNAKYMSGVTTRNEVPYASYWDIDANSLMVLDEDIYSDAVAWTITNDGIPLIARPYLTPYADAYVYYDGFLYSFEELLTQVYGLDLGAYGLDVTGKPFKVSSDGRTIVFIIGIGNCYVLRLKENIQDALAKVDLFREWSTSPKAGTKMTMLGSVTLNFQHEIELVNDGDSGIRLLDKDGNQVSKPATTGVKVSNTTLSLRFPNYPMKAGETYTLSIPAGTIQFKGQKKVLNPEISIQYEGRENVPVKPVRFNPANGSSMSSISLSDNPVSVVFDNQLLMNVPSPSERPVAKVYIDGETDLVGFANLDVDQNTGNTLVIFPDNPIPFYKGSSYTIVVPQGVVTDMSGAGGNDGFNITYEGSLVPQLGDDKYLFRSGCDDYTNFLFYEGDHGKPTSEYANMGFTADETPWSVVRDNDLSTDMAFGSHSSYNPLVQADDWVATRQILIPEDGKPYFAFDSQSYRKAKTDYLKVIIYENPSLINTFNSKIVDDIRENGHLVYNKKQDPGPTEYGIDGEWTHNVIDLSDYAGKSIYICFLNDNYNGSMVMIDNIEVVNDLSAFITLRNQTTVVKEDDIAIRGMLSISGETTSYSNVEMTLSDANGRKVSEIKESGLNLKSGDLYNFEFPQALPLKGGEVNRFTIDYKLGDDSFSYEGAISNLAFEPETHVVIEEFTGRNCVFCPGGIVTIEHLESLYGNKVIPVALHCYEGTDPKGRNVMAYASYLGMNAAPMARINRGPVASPLVQTPSGYTNTGTGGEKLWKDLVVEALGSPALIEIDVQPVEHTASTLNYEVYFKSALRLEDTHYRVFGVLLEDGLIDFQSNAYYSQSDPLLGEWGAGGLYGKSSAYYVFDNVARGVWGTSYSGTPGLLPSDWKAGDLYKVDVSMQIPDIVEDASKCRMVVMLIDETTGKVINTSRSDIRAAGVTSPSASGNDVKVSINGGVLNVTSATNCKVEAYDLQGRLIASGEGNGSFSVSLGGYNGLFIVRTVTGDSTRTEKYIVK